MTPDFRKLMLSRFFFTLGVQTQAVVLGWRMYDLTRDPLALGIVGLVEALPALSLALFAGYIVDRSRPLLIYRGVMTASLTSALVLLISQMNAHHFDVRTQVILLYVSSFITGMARGFAQPAMYATVPRLIPRDQLARSSAWMAATLQIARISGPAVGGVIFGFFGVVSASWFVTASIIVALIGMLRIRTKIDPPARGVGGSIKEELFSGARFVLSHPILFPALTLDMVAVLFGGVTALLPIYAAEVLMIGPKGLGFLRAAPAVGAALTSLFLTRMNLNRKAGRYLFIAVTGFGLCILVFGLSKTFLLSLIALALSGAFDSVSMVIRTAAVQLSSPDEMRGRISAVNSIFIGSSNELGEFESGVAAKLLGLVQSVVFGGLVCLSTVGACARFFPALRNLDLEALEEQERAKA